MCGGGPEHRALVADLKQRLAEPLAEQPAVGLREQRLRELVAATRRALVELHRLEWVAPRLDAVVNMRRRLGDQPCAADKRHDSGDDERDPRGGDVEQGQERPKNISDEPRSRIKISISIDRPQITRSGPKCLSDSCGRAP